jgi:hypothetical protein
MRVAGTLGRIIVLLQVLGKVQVEGWPFVSVPAVMIKWQLIQLYVRTQLN